MPESQFDTPLDYEAFAGISAMLGHGGVVAFDDTVDMAKMARYAIMKDQSCMAMMEMHPGMMKMDMTR